MKLSVSDPSSGSTTVRAAHRSWIWALIALTPVALAVVSWDPVGVYHPVQAWLRLYGIAAVVVELTVILCSILSGTGPLEPLGSLPVWAKAALAILIGVGFFTALFVAPDWLRATQWTFFSIIHLLFGLAVAAFARNLDSRSRLAIWKAVLAGLLGFLIVVVIFVIVATRENSLNWKYFGLGGTNIRQIGFYSAVGAAAALGLGTVEARRRQQIGWALGAVLMLALSFWSGTRGSLLAVIVAFAVGAIRLPALRTARSWVTLMASMTAAAMLSQLGPIPDSHYGIVRLKTSLKGSAADVSSERFDMWAGTWSAILHRPISGYGAGQLVFVVPSKFGGFNHPHNIVLQVLFQWGLIGAVCYFSLAALVAGRVFAALRSPQPADAPALLVGTALLTMSLYEGSLFHSFPTMTIALALALLIAPRREPAGTTA